MTNEIDPEAVDKIRNKLQEVADLLDEIKKGARYTNDTGTCEECDEVFGDLTDIHNKIKKIFDKK